MTTNPQYLDWPSDLLASVLPSGTVESCLDRINQQLKELERCSFNTATAEDKSFLEEILADTLRISMAAHLRKVSDEPNLEMEVQAEQAMALYQRAEVLLLTGQSYVKPALDRQSECETGKLSEKQNRSILDFRKEFSITLSNGERIGLGQGFEILNDPKQPHARREEVATSFMEYSAEHKDELTAMLIAALKRASEYRTRISSRSGISYYDGYETGMDALVRALPDLTLSNEGIMTSYLRMKGEKFLKWPDFLLRPENAGHKIEWKEVRQSLDEAFLEFDPTISQAVTRLFDEGRIRTIVKSKTPSFCTTYYIPGQLPLINAEFHGTILDAHYLSHEIGHAVHGMSMKDLSFQSRGTPSLVLESVAQFFAFIWVDYVLRTSAITHPSLSTALYEPHLFSLVRRGIIAKFEMALEEALDRTTLNPENISNLWITSHRTSLKGMAEVPESYRSWWGLTAWVMSNPLQQTKYVAAEIIAAALFSSYLTDPVKFRTSFIPLLSKGGLTTKELLNTMGFTEDSKLLIRRAEIALNSLWRN